MQIPKLIEERIPGLAAISALFMLQAIYGQFFCDGRLAGFLWVTLILMVPIAIGLTLSGSTAAIAMCAALLPFILWANAVECRPYEGGGAAMAYVVVFLYGVPTSIASAMLAVFVKRRFNAG
ncbi:hypothetical protein [Polaromonas sp. YR568]|uniref:hypothetical protein n=1 Tax=Polaromonas sp. YR568 TaxID=1855301 RepID=UPI003137DF68